ncbi:hypothetical protein TNCV_4308771 [Trichonephila clavipes]|nr:hypothetical protein TNCV_4308771 [Trichonephila clavipes]
MEGVIKLDAEAKESKEQVGEGVIKSFPNSVVNEINTQGFIPPRSFQKTTSTLLGLRHEGGEQSLRTRRIGEAPEFGPEELVPGAHGGNLVDRQAMGCERNHPPHGYRAHPGGGVPHSLRNTVPVDTAACGCSWKRDRCSSDNANSDEQKANLLALTLKNNFIENKRHDDKIYPIDDNITNTLGDFLSHPSPLPIALTNPDEITDYVKRLPNNKAPGSDNITNKMVKNFPT